MAFGQTTVLTITTKPIGSALAAPSSMQTRA